MSEDGGSPRPVDPNSMDVDTVNSPPSVSHQQGGCESMFSSVLNNFFNRKEAIDLLRRIDRECNHNNSSGHLP